MKAISPVIVIILVLAIVVALAVLAFTWFTGIFSQLTTQVGTTVTTTTVKMGTALRVESVFNVTPTLHINTTIRNVGRSDINASEIAGYLDGEYVPILDYAPCGGLCIWTSSGSLIISYGDIAMITFNTSGTGSVCDKSLKVTTGTGLSDSKKVVCV